MTRTLLSLLAVAEAVLGMFVLVNTIGLLLSHGAGMAAVFLPVLAVGVLLLAAGAAIFVRQPWSYWTHIGAVLLIGLLFLVYGGQILSSDAVVWLSVAGTVVALLTGLFLFPPVRRYFHD